MTRTSEIAILVTTLWMVLSVSIGFAQDDAKLIWKRELAEDVPGHYERNVLVRERKLPSEKDIEKWKQDPSIEKIEIINDRDVRITFARDLWKAAAEKKWREESEARFVIRQDIGLFRYDGCNFYREGGAWILPDDPRLPVDMVIPRYRQAENKFAEVNITTVSEPHRIEHHEFLRWVIKRECIPITLAGQLVLQCKIRDKGGSAISYAWQVGDHMCIAVGGASIEDPRVVAETYAKKYPSTLPADFKVDKTAWGRREVELWIGRLSAVVEAGDPGRSKGFYSFMECLSRGVSPTVFMPLFQEISPEKVAATAEGQKHLLELVVKWWQAHKDSTYWHTKLQMLVAKGQSPDELREAAEKKQRQDITDKLNAPLKPEKELVGQLVRRFEAQQQASLKESPENRRAFEKIEDGVWKLQWRQYVKGYWSDVTIRGPKLEKTSSKRYPLVGIFTKHAVEQETGKQYRVMDECYYYDKLHDQWVFGELPKE